MKKSNVKKSIGMFSLILFIFCLIPLSSALYGEWVSYGSSRSQEILGGSIDSRVINTQQSYLNGDFYNNDILNINISNGQNQTDIGNQVFISSLGGSSSPYLILNNKTGVSLYVTNGSNMVLYASFNPTYTFTGQNSIFNQKYAMIGRENSSRLKYLEYSFDVIGKTFSLDVNYSIDNPDVVKYNAIIPSALKCDVTECFAMISLKNSTSNKYDFYLFNYTTGGSLGLVHEDTGSTSNFIQYPASKITDTDGIVKYIAFSDKKLVVFNSALTTLFTKYGSYGGAGVAEKEFFRVGTFIKDSSSYYNVVVGTEKTLGSGELVTCTLGYYTCVTYYLYNMSGSEIWKEEVSLKDSSGSPYPRIRGFSLQDYNGDSYEDLFLINSRSPYLVILKGSDGSTLFSNTTASIGAENNNIIPKSTLGRLSTGGVDYTYIVYDDLGYVRVYNPYSTTYSSIFSAKFSSVTGYGNCITGDLNTDNLLDIVCSNEQQTALYFGGDYNFTTPELNITGGIEGFNDIVTGLESLFPDSDDLTTGQRLMFVFLFEIILFFIILLPAILIKSDSPHLITIMLYVGLFACLLAFFYFISIGYIGTGVLITLALVGVGVGYLKFIKTGG